MLFDASATYAPNQARGDVPYGEYQNVDLLGRYDLSRLGSPNVLIGLGALVAIAYYLHRRGRRR